MLKEGGCINNFDGFSFVTAIK